MAPIYWRTGLMENREKVNEVLLGKLAIELG